jgi:pyridoxal/pyridoxine/pyridoxamine kinase
MADTEAILDALAAGLPILKAAKQFRLSECEVRKILKDEIRRWRDGEHLREAWALADRRLQAAEVKFYNKAMEGEGDCAAAVVFTKINERRATLNGANMPQAHVLQVVSAPQQTQTSTERIRAALDRLRESKQSCDNGEDILPQPH